MFLLNRWQNEVEKHVEWIKALEFVSKNPKFKTRQFQIPSTAEEKAFFHVKRQEIKQKAIVGSTIGGISGIGMWKLCGGQSIFFGVLASSLGLLTALTYSMLPVPRQCSIDLLSLPRHHSSQVAEIRDFLEAELPDNLFVLEILQRTKENQTKTTAEAAQAA